MLGPCQAKCLSMLFTTSCHTQTESDLCLAPAKQNAFHAFHNILSHSRKVTCAWPLPSKMPFHAFTTSCHTDRKGDLLGCQAKCLSMLFTTSCAWPLPSKMPFHAFHNILSQESDLCLAPAKQNAFPCFSQHLVTQTGK